MTYTIQGGAVQTKYTKLTTTAATTVLDGGQSGAIVVAIYAAEITGNTPLLTIDHYDGTTATYLRNAKAMTAREEYGREVIIVLKAGQLLRATAGTANQIDVMVTYINRDATAKGGAM